MTDILAEAAIDGGSFTLTATHLQQYRDGGAVGDAIIGSGGGLIGGLLGGAVKALSKAKPVGDPIPLSSVRAARAFANEKKGATFVLAFLNGKDGTPLYVEKLDRIQPFVAQVNEQIGRVRSSPPSHVAPPLVGAPIALDPRVAELPGWEALPQWSSHKLQGDPLALHLPIAAGTSESLFFRSNASIGNGTVRFVYRAVTATGGYLGVRARSDGKTYAVVRVNAKGEYQVNTHTEKGEWVRDALLHADPQRWNEVRVELVGTRLALYLNGGLATVVDGMNLPTGRVVLTGSASQGAEFAIGAFEIYPPNPAAPPLPLIVKEGTLLFDVKNKAMPGWQVLQQWSPSTFECDPADARLKIANEGTAEALFVRTKDEFTNCRINLRYSFPVLPRFGYLALRVRSDGKAFGLLRINNKGEVAVSATAAIANAWTKVPALHTDQPNDVVIEITGATMKVTFNGTQSISKDGLEAASGRIVLVGAADPKPAEISIGALTVTPL